MYQDAGPSRSGPTYGSNRDTPLSRPAPSRFEQDLEGDNRGLNHPRGLESSNRPFSNSSSLWARQTPRTTSRPYPNGPPRARTPSPPRQTSEWDRERDRLRDRPRPRSREREWPGPDARDRLSSESGFRAPVPTNFTTSDRRNGSVRSAPTRDNREHPAGDRERRWNTPRADDTRPRPRQSFSPVKGYTPYDRDRPNPSPPKPRPGPAQSPWSGTPRPTNQSRASFQTPRDRDERGGPPLDRTPLRDLIPERSRSSEGGPGPSSAAYQASVRSSPAGSPTRPPRSLRGSSSPVETRRRLDIQPIAQISSLVPPPQPAVKREVEEGELEEGEVLSSPVRSERELARPLELAPSVQPRDRHWDRPVPTASWGWNRDAVERPRDRELDGRRPAQMAGPPIDRAHGPHRNDHPFEPWRAGYSDDGWGSRRRLTEVPRDRSVERDEKANILDWEENRHDIELPNEQPAEGDEDDDRPPTPPLPSAGLPDTVYDSESRGLAPAQALPPSAEDTEITRPDTPAFPPNMQEPPVGDAPSDAPYAPAPNDESSSPSEGAAHPAEASGVSSSPLVIAQQLVISESPVVLQEATPDMPAATVSAAPPVLEPRDIPQANTSADETAAPAVSAQSTSSLQRSELTPPLLGADLPVDHLTPQFRAPLSPLLTLAPKSPSAPRQTLAERRAVQLPATQMSSPFGNRTMRKDPMPTNDSAQNSTDTEVWPRTADIDDAGSDTSDDLPPEKRESRLVSVMKLAQRKARHVDVNAIVAWNVRASPAQSQRVDTGLECDGREERLQNISWDVEHQQVIVADLVAKRILQEHERSEERAETLRLEYQALDEEWREHCMFLDELMEKRGPPPESLYALPNAVPVVTPGPAPMTPVIAPDDILTSRGMRRRGAGDAVTTEAEFQEILAAMADTAAKDPNYRASKTTVAVPDMLGPEERRLRYVDENDLVDDPIAFYDFKGNAEAIWTDEERQIFVRRYLNFPKQFGKIAELLPNKSASDCVLYYYRTKKEVDYKSMLASRRGVTRRKAMPIIKKGGKSAALLASLDQKKPTVDSATMRNVPITAPTPVRARDKDKERDDSAPPAPGTGAKRGRPRMDGSGARRRIVDVQAEDGEAADAADAAAAMEGTSAKAKHRHSLKGPKRSRRSSISAVQPLTPGAPVFPVHPDDLQALPNPLDPTAVGELLPPVKRARKTRKSNPAASDLVPEIGPDGFPLPPGEKGASRRGNTSSYWSVDEKKRLSDLVAMHHRDLRSIAAGLHGKSERQISNYIQSNALALGLEPTALGFDLDGSTPGYTPPFTKDEYFKPSAGYSRSIYDVYGSYQPAGYNTHEPRLGVFPSMPRGQPATATAAIAQPLLRATPTESPVKPTPRIGGMRISALLNDDPLPDVEVRRETGDAQSDGTVDDRDEATRPSPRGMPPLPQPRRPSTSHEERYRNPPPAGYMYHPAPVPATATATWQRRPSDALYNPRAVSPVQHIAPSVRAHHSHSVPPVYHSMSAPYPARSTAEYYHPSSRPEPYRAQTSVVDARVYAPPRHPPAHLAHGSQPPAGHSTAPPLPPNYPPRDMSRYEQPRQQDWRAFSQPPQQQPAPAPGHTPAPATPASGPASRTQGWYDSPKASQQAIMLPSIRKIYEDVEERR